MSPLFVRPRPHPTTIVCAIALAGCGPSLGGASEPSCSDDPTEHSADLACTGLYADAASGTLAADVNAYEPAFSLWSDGAEKRRFIRLPPGTSIDTSDLDQWKFPVGTKLWKEFAIGGRKVETRYLKKQSDGTWFFTTYVWSDDQSQAREITTGVKNMGGTGYEILPTTECASCHDGAKDRVLGFEAVGLSAAGASGLTLDELARRGLVTDPPQAPLAIPGEPKTVEALGWLHANCGNACHNRSQTAHARGTGLFMRLTTNTLTSVEQTDTYATAVGVRSGFQPQPGATFSRIAPGDADHSSIPYRALARDSETDNGSQMPPLGSHVPDLRDVATLRTWINAM
jgi:hypothetical protein